MMALRDAGAGPQPNTTLSHREPQGQRYSGPILVKLTLNWGAQDRYDELMNFKMEVFNILATKAYTLSEEEKAPVIKQMVGPGGSAANTNLYSRRKRKMQNCKGSFCNVV